MVIERYPVRGPVVEVVLPDLRRFTRRETAPAIDLRNQIWEYTDDDQVKVIVLRSAGKDFCPANDDAGQPVEPPRASGYGDTINEIYFGGTGIYQTLCFAKKIIVSEVTGECAGAGALFALYSDFVVAEEGTVFHPPYPLLPETNLALSVLSMRLNRSRTWFFSQLPLSAEDARTAGIVTSVAAASRLKAATAAIADRVAKMPQDPLVLSKLSLVTYLDTQGVAAEFEATSFHEAASQLARGGV